MRLVVTGISQNRDMRGLEPALKPSGLALDPIQLIGWDVSSRPPASAAGLANPAGPGHRSVISAVSRSIGRPGSRAYFHNERLRHRHGDLEVPDAQLDNYIEALEAWCSAVACLPKPDSATQGERIFRNSDLVGIRTY